MWGVGQNRKGVGFGVFAEMGMVLLDVDCRFGEEDGISKRYAAFNEGREDKKKRVTWLSLVWKRREEIANTNSYSCYVMQV